jgi:hypothetical protein
VEWECEELCLQRGALDSNQGVDGHRLRVLWEGGQLVQQAHTVHGALAKANDAACAHRDAGRPHARKRVQPVLRMPAVVLSRSTLHTDRMCAGGKLMPCANPAIFPA